MFVFYRLWIIGSKRWAGKSNQWRQDEKQARDQEAGKHAVRYQGIIEFCTNHFTPRSEKIRK
jgi:hypothetical protein